MQIRLLFTVSLSHGYYEKDCKDFGFVIPADSAHLIKKGRLITKIREGRLFVFYTSDQPPDQAGGALGFLNNQRLRLGLKLLNPYFSNFTDLDSSLPSTLPSTSLPTHPFFLYRNPPPNNTTQDLILDGPQAVTLVGQTFRHPIRSTARPLTVVLKAADDRVLQTDTLTTANTTASTTASTTANNNSSTLLYEIEKLAGKVGVYRVEESSSAAAVEQFIYYVDAELQREGIWGVIEIAIAEQFYTRPPEVPAPNFVIQFTPKAEILKYYVVVHKSSEGQFTIGDLNNLMLSVTDAGFTLDGRPSLQFTPVSSADFTEKEISPTLLLGNSKAQVLLFKSQAEVARQEKARHSIQLKKNGTVLIPQLPQPSAAQATSDLIIQLTTR